MLIRYLNNNIHEGFGSVKNKGVNKNNNTDFNKILNDATNVNEFRNYFNYLYKGFKKIYTILLNNPVYNNYFINIIYNSLYNTHIENSVAANLNFKFLSLSDHKIMFLSMIETCKMYYAIQNSTDYNYYFDIYIDYDTIMNITTRKDKIIKNIYASYDILSNNIKDTFSIFKGDVKILPLSVQGSSGDDEVDYIVNILTKTYILHEKYLQLMNDDLDIDIEFIDYFKKDIDDLNSALHTYENCFDKTLVSRNSYASYLHYKKADIDIWGAKDKNYLNNLIKLYTAINKGKHIFATEQKIKIPHIFYSAVNMNGALLAIYHNPYVSYNIQKCRESVERRTSILCDNIKFYMDLVKKGDIILEDYTNNFNKKDLPIFDLGLSSNRIINYVEVSKNNNDEDIIEKNLNIAENYINMCKNIYDCFSKNENLNKIYIYNDFFIMHEKDPSVNVGKFIYSYDDGKFNIQRQLNTKITKCINDCITDILKSYTENDILMYTDKLGNTLVDCEVIISFPNDEPLNLNGTFNPELNFEISIPTSTNSTETFKYSYSIIYDKIKLIKK